MASMPVRVSLMTSLMDVVVKESDSASDAVQTIRTALKLNPRSSFSLLFRGRPLPPEESIWARGVRPNAKLILREEREHVPLPQGVQRTPQTAKTKQAEVVDVTQSPAISSLAKVTARVDELEADILAALSAPQNTPKQRVVGLAEYVEQAMLALDGVEADGDETVRARRKEQIKRCQALLSKLDTIRKS